MREQQVWDTVIVGAGMAGLTASILLARAGRQVLVVDQAAEAGGRGRSTIWGEARLNLGAHALYPGSIAILREVGVQPTGGAPKSNGALVFGGGPGENGALKAVPFLNLLLGSQLAWPEKMELLKFYRRLRQTDLRALERVTLQQYLEDTVPHPAVRRLVETLIRVSSYSNAPDRVSAGAVLANLLNNGKVFYADGGWQALTDALMQQARQAGVAFRFGMGVKSIGGQSPALTVLTGDGTLLQARTVLSTAGPAATAKLLERPLPPAAAAAWDRLTPVHAACLDLVAAGMPKPRNTFSLGVDAPWYFSNHSAGAKLTGTLGHEVIHVMKYLPPHAAQRAEETERELESFLDIIQPGWRQHVVHRRFLPHMLVSHALVTAQDGGLAGRPGTSVPGTQGLFVAGDWVGGEGMLLEASLSSSKAAAEAILRGTESTTPREKDIRHGA